MDWGRSDYLLKVYYGVGTVFFSLNAAVKRRLKSRTARKPFDIIVHGVGRRRVSMRHMSTNFLSDVFKLRVESRGLLGVLRSHLVIIWIHILLKERVDCLDLKVKLDKMTVSLGAVLFNGKQKRVKDVFERLNLINSIAVFLDPGWSSHHKRFVFFCIGFNVFVRHVMSRGRVGSGTGTLTYFSKHFQRWLDSCGRPRYLVKIDSFVPFGVLNFLGQLLYWLCDASVYLLSKQTEK